MRVFVYEHLCSGELTEQPGADSLRREGLAMLGAVLADLARCPDVQPVALVEPALVGSLRALVPSREVHARDGSSTREQFQRLAQQANFTQVIAPEFDDLLHERCVWACEAGRLLGPTPQAVRLTADKLALASRLREHGIPTPLTRSAGRWPSLPFPLVCKPRFGAGSQFTCLVADEAQYDHHLGSSLRAGIGAMIVQRYVRGMPASVAFLAGPGRLIPLPAAEQCLSADNRFSWLGGRLPLSPPLQARAQRLAERAVRTVPGLMGYFGVDLVLGSQTSGGQDQVIEINPRLTTSYVGLRHLAHGNLMQALLAITCGQEHPALTWKDVAVRFWADGRID